MLSLNHVLKLLFKSNFELTQNFPLLLILSKLVDKRAGKYGDALREMIFTRPEQQKVENYFAVNLES